MLAALYLVMAQAATAPPVQKPDTVSYIVKPGDTLDTLSRRFIVERYGWHSLIRLAGVRDPRHLPIGRRLDIPRHWLRYTVEPARVASFRGTVSIAVNGRMVKPATGQDMREGAVITTAANSFVTLTLADSSQIVVPSQTQIRIRQLRRILLTGAVDYRIDVDRGRLETKVAPLKHPSGRYRVGTPVSMTAVRGTEFRTSFVPETGNGQTEVLEGGVTFSGSEREESAMRVESGMGAITGRTGAAQVERLLGAPELADAGHEQTGDNVEFMVKPVSGAARYRIVIASDAGFIENIAETFSDTEKLAFADVPDGNQFARVTAITPQGLEGLSRTYGFKRRLASINASAGVGDDGFHFRWSGSGAGKRRYHFQLFEETDKAIPIVDRVGLEESEIVLRNLEPGNYSWRVGLLQIETGEVIKTWTPLERMVIAPPSARPRR
jgi:hypothetical protein